MPLGVVIVVFTVKSDGCICSFIAAPCLHVKEWQQYTNIESKKFSHGFRELPVN